MSAKILVVVEDLFFLAKIQQSARQLGITIEPVTPGAVQTNASAQRPGAILLDLNHRSGKAIAALQALKNDPTTGRVPVVGFLSHVQTDLAQAARSAGCDRVLARSAFSQQLPQLLQELSKRSPSSE